MFVAAPRKSLVFLESPARDQITIFWPAGDTNSMSTSPGKLCQNWLIVTCNFEIVPLMFETTICEGYGVAIPWVGMMIGVGLANLADPDGGGLTVKRKLLVAVLVPSLTMIEMVQAPVCPNAGTTEMDLLV